MSKTDVINYRGRTLRKIEWGLYRNVDDPKEYLLNYRPAGRNGPRVRQFAVIDDINLRVEDLQNHVRKARSMINARKIGIAPRYTLTQLRDAYIADLKRRNRKPQWLVDVKYTLNKFIEYCPVDAADRVDSAIIAQFLRKQKEISARTQNKYRGHLFGWFKFAIQEGIVDRNPVETIRRATVDSVEKAFPTIEQFGKICGASDPYDAAIWILLAFTGLRRGSFLSLSTDPESRILDDRFIVDTKRRIVWHLRFEDGCPLWCADLAELARLVWQHRQPTPAYIRKHWENNPVVKQQGFTLHSLRHAFASWLVWAGESYSDVAAWCHHASAVTTERWYGHLRPRGRERQAENRKAVVNMRTQLMERYLRQLTQVVDK